MELTLRKNNPPAGSTILEPGSTFKRSPSLYHSIVGFGDPSALQFNVAGSCFGTITSNGCSVIRGYSIAEKKKKKKLLIICYFDANKNQCLYYEIDYSLNEIIILFMFSIYFVILFIYNLIHFPQNDILLLDFCRVIEN